MEFEHFTTPPPYKFVIKNTLFVLLETWQCLPDSYFAAIYCCTTLDVNEGRHKIFEYEVKERLLSGQLELTHTHLLLSAQQMLCLIEQSVNICSQLCLMFTTNTSVPFAWYCGVALYDKTSKLNKRKFSYVWLQNRPNVLVVNHAVHKVSVLGAFAKVSDVNSYRTLVSV